jgi:hypothetical protein
MRKVIRGFVSSKYAPIRALAVSGAMPSALCGGLSSIAAVFMKIIFLELDTRELFITVKPQ